MQLKMTITQHTNSVNVLYDIKDYFGCGSMVVHNKSGDRMPDNCNRGDTKCPNPFLRATPLTDL